VLTAALAIAHRWKGRLFSSVIDQGSFSAVNFLLTIIYASSLRLDDFGSYVLVWTVSLFIEGIAVSLIVDSMPAIASRYGRHGRRRIDASALWLVLLFGGVTSLLLLVTLPVVEVIAPGLVVPLACLALVNPLQRLHLFLRRLCYIRDRQGVTATASIAYGATCLLGAVGLVLSGTLSVPAAILLWGVGAAVASSVILLNGVARFRAVGVASTVWLGRRLWQSGRWLVGAAIIFWFINWGVFPLIAAFGGLEAAGVVRALQNLFTPIVQFNAALNLTILPRLADKVAMQGLSVARSFAFYGTLAFTGIVAIYSAIILLNSGTILAIYRKPEILQATRLLWPLAIAMMLEAARQGAAMALLTLTRTRIAFFSRMIGGLVFLGSVFLLTQALGFEGVLWANVAAQFVGAILIIAAAVAIRDTSDENRPEAERASVLVRVLNK